MGWIMPTTSEIIKELSDIAKIEGAGAVVRGLARGLPQARMYGATASGLASYQNELDNLANSNISDIERYGRAGLVGISDGIYGLVPFGDAFKDIAQYAMKHAATGLANIGSNMINNRAMESLNDTIWSR